MSTKAPKEEKLEPIDASRCQAERRAGSFMTLGPRPMVRCTNVPTWIAVAVKEGRFDGAMSLCGDCKKVCELELPEVAYQELQMESKEPVTIKKDIVQTKNPKTERYVKIDRLAGRILAHKKSPGPYKNIPMAKKEKED